MNLAEQDIARFVANRLQGLQNQTDVQITGVAVDLVTHQSIGQMPSISGATVTIHFSL